MSEYRKDVLALVVATVLLMLVWLPIKSAAVFVLRPERVAVEARVYEERDDLEPVRELLGHARINVERVSR